jgi:hypothetical protein
MRNFDLISGIGRLKRSSAQLKEKWLNVRDHWDDQASRDFEKEFLQMLAPQLTLVMAALHEFHDVMQQAGKELEDPGNGE